VQPWKRAYSLHSHKEETIKGANPSWCALPSASENSKEKILSLREWLANEIIFLSEVEAWKTKSPGGIHEGRCTGYSSENPKNEIGRECKMKTQKRKQPRNIASEEKVRMLYFSRKGKNLQHIVGNMGSRDNLPQDTLHN
jgi:hypothetical protein